MSQRSLPLVTEFALDFGSDFDFQGLLTERDTNDNTGLVEHPKESPSRDSSGESSGISCVNNPLFTQSTSGQNTPKLEEWQLVPDDVLWYWDLDNSELSDSKKTQGETPFFHDVAKELNFCREKLDEIKESYVESEEKQRCALTKIPSADNSPISWCSQSLFSYDCDFYDLPGFSQQNESFQSQGEPPKQNNALQSDTSNTSFLAISPIEGTLSSFEEINKLRNQFEKRLERVETSDEPLAQSVGPQDSVASYNGDVSEALFFSLVQDFSLDSPTWDDFGTPNIFTDKHNQPIDRQPQSLQVGSEVTSNQREKTKDQGLITISYDISNSTPPAPDHQCSMLLEPPAPDYQCSKLLEQPNKPTPNQTYNTVGDFYSNLDFKNSLITQENVQVDGLPYSPTIDAKTIAASQQTVPDNKHGEGDIMRQKKWWSSEVDKKDISFLRVPWVSASGLVFHGDQNGAVKVGEGSFGTVFLADLYIGRAVYQVVVKDFSPKGVTKPAEILEEARVLMHLSDTMFIPYFYGLLPVATPQQYAIVQEYFARGTSLHNILEDKSLRLSPVSWINLCVQLAVGLDRFHRKGILMNDIKKDNILVECRNKDCVLKYIDMGLASYKTGRVFYGSEEYMQQFSHLAPEVRRLEKTSPASDVYSIGKILMSIAKYAPLRQIRELVTPCVSHSPLNRPHLHQIICELLTIRDHIYNSSTSVPQPHNSLRRWFC